MGLILKGVAVIQWKFYKTAHGESNDQSKFLYIRTSTCVTSFISLGAPLLKVTVPPKTMISLFKRKSTLQIMSVKMYVSNDTIHIILSGLMTFLYTTLILTKLCLKVTTKQKKHWQHLLFYKQHPDKTMMTSSLWLSSCYVCFSVKPMQVLL